MQILWNDPKWRHCSAHGKKCNMKNHFAKMCTTATSKARNQESQRKTQTPVKSMTEKPTRTIHKVEES